MRWNYLCGSHRVGADLMLMGPHLYSGGLGLGLTSEARARHLAKQLQDVPHVAVDPRLERLQLPKDQCCNVQCKFSLPPRPHLAIVSILASRSSGAASIPPPELGLDPGLGLEAAGAASPPTDPDTERGMSSSEELKFRAHQSQSILSFARH